MPGFVDGAFALLDHYGTRSFAELADAAVGYAANGFPVTPGEASAAAFLEDELRQYPATAAVFLPNGKPLKAGEILRQPDLARSISQIARGGPDYFYRGPIAKAITDFLGETAAHCPPSLPDHATDIGTPLSTTYRATPSMTGLPTQGFVVLAALNIRERRPG